jgi:hypothetical protein
LVINEVTAEERKRQEPEYSPLVSVSGEHILSAPQSIPLYPHYKIKVWLLAIFLILLMAGICYFTWEITNDRSDDISAINDTDFLDVVSGWGVTTPPAGSTGGEGYEEINSIRFLPFKDKYDLMLIARLSDTHLSAFKDRSIVKGTLFPVPPTPLSSMRMTVHIPGQLLTNASAMSDPAMEFHLCLIPRTMDASTVVDLSDLTARGGHVFAPTHSAGISVGLDHLPPPSPLAPVLINAISEIVSKDDAARTVIVEINFVAVTDFQTKVSTHVTFFWDGHPAGQPVNADATFTAKNQVGTVRSTIQLAPPLWSAFLSSPHLTLRALAEYQDRGAEMQYSVRGSINSNSSQLDSVTIDRVKLR